MGSSKCGGIVHRLTANYQNLRRYERNNQTSVIHGTLYNMGGREPPHRVAEKNEIYIKIVAICRKMWENKHGMIV